MDACAELERRPGCSSRGAAGTAIANVRAVAEAQLHEPVGVDLPEGQRVEFAEPPVRRRRLRSRRPRPYPSTVVMCAVTARVAGVEEIAVCAPAGPGRRGPSGDPGGLRALRGDEVYRMGGAQAIAALALWDRVRAPST